jgi:hypothetical protein
MKNIILETDFINDAIKRLAEASNKNEIAEKLALKSISAEYYGDDDLLNMLYFYHNNFEFYMSRRTRKEGYRIFGYCLSCELHNITEILTYASSITSFVKNINKNIALALTFIK